MTPPLTLMLKLPREAATIRLGAAIAPLLKPGDLVLLDGDLGTGKTALARAIIRALVGDETLDVPSPSFSLVQPYTTGAFNLLHADLYRLADALEINELGLLDEVAAIVLVEWPERAPALFDKARLIVRLSLAGEDGRQADLEARQGDFDLAIIGTHMRGGAA